MSDTPQRPARVLFQHMDRLGMMNYIVGLESYATSLESQLAALKKEREWRPIDTAPKDGTKIQLAWPYKKTWDQSLGWWDKKFQSDDGKKYRGAWTDGTVASFGYEECTELNPTHWLPLPTPPHQEQGR